MVLYLKPQNTLHTNLVFSDEFNEGKLDLSSWSYELGNGCPNLCGWGNNELQVYTKKNVSTVNNQLVILATNQGDNYYSGRILTKDKFEFKYGTVEESLMVCNTEALKSLSKILTRFPKKLISYSP